MDETKSFNELWDDDILRENCRFPIRGIPHISDIYDSRWQGACCDATSMLFTMKANFFAKEYNKPITNVVLLKKSDTTQSTEDLTFVKTIIINNK